MAGTPHLAFPVRLDANGRFVEVEQDSLDHLADQIHLALLTHPPAGSPLRPTFGTPDLAFMEQPLDWDALSDLVVELVPGVEAHIEQLDALIERGLVRANVYVEG